MNCSTLKKILLVLSLHFVNFVQSQVAPVKNPLAIGKSFYRITDFDEYKNYIEAEGTLIGPIKERIGFRRFTNGKKNIILCTRYLNPKSSQILAILFIDKTEKGTQIAMGNCRQNGTEDNYIIAITKPPKGQFAKNILKAWKVEIQLNQFKAISVTGIDCINLEDGNE